MDAGVIGPNAGLVIRAIILQQEGPGFYLGLAVLPMSA